MGGSRRSSLTNKLPLSPSKHSTSNKKDQRRHSIEQPLTPEIRLPDYLKKINTEQAQKVIELTEEEKIICFNIGIQPKEFVELREVFRLVDKDGGGTISKDELQILMQTLGLRASKEELDAMINEIVADKEEIDLESFIWAMSRKVMPSQPQHILMNAFRLYDEGGYYYPTGKIKTQVLIDLIVNKGTVEKRLKPNEVEELISQIAPRALEDGIFDYKNYLSMLFAE